MRFLSVFSLFILSVCCTALDFSDLIGRNYEIFSVNRPRFITRKSHMYFSWTSDAKDTARYPAWKNSPQMTCFGQPVQEILVRFKENSLESLYVSVYNRGDAGEIPIGRMNEIVTALGKNISQKMNGIQPESKKIKLTNSAPVYSQIWRGKNFTYTLRWSTTGRRTHAERPEYIQLELCRSSTASFNLTDKLTEQTKYQLVKNVQRDEKGNVWINSMPMVDQGRKGYCAAAVAERVFRYYGYPVTQHTFAQLAGTGASTGTNSDAFIESLRKVAGKFGVRCRVFFNLFASLENLDKLLQVYNKQAKKKKKPRVGIVKRGNTVFLNETMEKMDPELYIAVRQNDRSGMRRFSGNIHSRVNEGLPTIWFVTLGLVPEEKLNPQTRGGHVRLIIGYNDRNREIIYTDTWGIGHEKKSMPVENAWAITNIILNVDPKR